MTFGSIAEHGLKLWLFVLASGCAAAGPAPELWREAPGPGWVMLEPVRAGRAVFLEPGEVRRQGEMRGATVVLNTLEPVRDRTGRRIRSQVFRLEADCETRLYRPLDTAQFDGFAGRGEQLAAASLDDLAPRPAVAGSVAEQIVATLCAP